ncbi:MAG TPA: pyridoxamine 5'-phosphate oxidase family protein [Myxococcota bacterium]|jgi:nitroimidazol reductase NimA-like FMN-containing flavoprotein (pyridoxamine 5'-phosphate oxidase superfamily)
MARTHDHEIVSIYPFSDREVDELMNHSNECVLMWTTKDGWPVGVTHAFVWHGGKIWLTFASHRHRAAAIRRDPRVSINVSSSGYPASSGGALPRGAITFKGRAAFFDDDETKRWFYTALSRKLNPNNPAGERAFYSLLDSPLRTILAITPEKKIMYNGKTANAHMAGTIAEDELGARLTSDSERMNRERARKGLAPR